MKQLEAKVRMAAIAALALVAAQAMAADAVKSLADEWRVSGEGIEGVVRLPGTLADAKLGRHKTAADWVADTNRASKGALTREWQYRGKAVYERSFDLAGVEAKHPLELVLERGHELEHVEGVGPEVLEAGLLGNVGLVDLKVLADCLDDLLEDGGAIHVFPPKSGCCSFKPAHPMRSAAPPVL